MPISRGTLPRSDSEIEVDFVHQRSPEGDLSRDSISDDERRSHYRSKDSAQDSPSEYKEESRKSSSYEPEERKKPPDSKGKSLAKSSLEASSSPSKEAKRKRATAVGLLMGVRSPPSPPISPSFSFRSTIDLLPSSAKRHGLRQQVIVTTACCLGPLVCGFSFAYGLMRNTSARAHLSVWNTYAFFIGSLVGGFFSGVVINHGRKVAMWFMILPFSFNWTIAIFATQVWTRLLFHASAGVGVGLLAVVSQIYVAEISLPRVRGAICTVPLLAYLIGMLLCFTMAEVMMGKHLAVMGFCLCFPLFLSLILCIPESPRFLIRNKPDEALATLQWLRGTESDVSEEYHDISDSCDEEKWRFSCEDLIRPTFWRPMLVSTGLMILFSMTGIVSFALYGVELFHDVTVSYLNTAHFVLTSVYIIAATVSLLLVDHIGRKLLLLLSLTIMAASAFVLGLFLFLKDLHNVRNYFLYQWVAEVFCVLLFTFSHGIGLGPIAWVTLGEIFGSKLKWLSVSVVSAVFWSSMLAADALNHVIRRDVSTGGVFWFHCVTCVGGYIFVLVVFRELKEHRLDDITKCFTRKHDSLIETFIARV